MKKTLLIIVLLPLVSTAQLLSGIVKDSTSGELLKLANITFLKSNYGTNTNLDGNYVFNVNGHSEDSIKISFIGYKPKYLSLQKFSKNTPYTVNFLLAPEENTLNEVLINQKKTKYTKPYHLSDKREGDIAMFSLIGHETACLIENPKNETGRIKSLKLYVRKNKNADFIAKFRIKLYAYDSVEKRPGNNLLLEDLIISPKNKTYQYDLDLEDKKIPFPENGVCVGIELVDETSISKKGDKIGPGYRFTYGESKQLTWYNYRNKGWAKNDLYNKKSHAISNLMVSMTVLMKN